jgi:hypothetical protein
MANRWLESHKFLRNNPGECVAAARILRQTNWSQLIELLAH